MTGFAALEACEAVVWTVSAFVPLFSTAETTVTSTEWAVVAHMAGFPAFEALGLFVCVAVFVASLGTLLDGCVLFGVVIVVVVVVVIKVIAHLSPLVLLLGVGC